MNSIARAAQDELKSLFSNVSVKVRLSPGIVEKDFWVVWTLDYRFARSPWKTQLAFKGGTSLSKAFGLIKRFSEDIDLILDWRLLGYGLREPWEKRSNTQQDLFNEAANARSATFLKDVLLRAVEGVVELDAGIAVVGVEPGKKVEVVGMYGLRGLGQAGVSRRIVVHGRVLGACRSVAAVRGLLLPRPRGLISGHARGRWNFTAVSLMRAPLRRATTGYQTMRPRASR